MLKSWFLGTLMEQSKHPLITDTSAKRRRLLACLPGNTRVTWRDVSASLSGVQPHSNISFFAGCFKHPLLFMLPRRIFQIWVEQQKIVPIPIVIMKQTTLLPVFSSAQVIPVTGIFMFYLIWYGAILHRMVCWHFVGTDRVLCDPPPFLKPLLIYSKIKTISIAKFSNISAQGQPGPTGVKERHKQTKMEKQGHKCKSQQLYN